MYFRSIKKTAGDLSLSDSIDTDKEGNSLSLMDVVCVDDDMFENVANSELRNLLKTHINALDSREREIIVMRYGLNGNPPLPQREVARVCGISRSYVSRIEKKAIEKLRVLFD